MSHKVFVYGSLRRGFSNNGLLESSGYLGLALTRARYTMHDLGYYPGVVRGGDTGITGELYEVGAETLAALDRLEGHPRYYRRTVAMVQRPGAGYPELAWVYLLPRCDHRVVRGGDWAAHREWWRDEYMTDEEVPT